MERFVEEAQDSRRALAIGYGGWACDAFDHQIVSLAIPLLLTALPMSMTAAGGIASAALIAAAIGGTLGGLAADRYGRLAVLQVAILIASVATAFCAMATTPDLLFAARTVQGFAFGAEWSAGAVLVAEAAGKRHRGLLMGLMQSAWATGWAAAVVAFLIATTLFTPDHAWRAMFIAGLLPLAFVVWLRWSGTDETINPVAPRMSDQQSGSYAGRSRLALTVTLGFGAHGGYHAAFTWLPTVIGLSGDDRTRQSLVLALAVLGFAIGCVVAGRIADQWGRRPTLALFAFGAALATCSIAFWPTMLAWRLLFAGLLGLAAGGVPAILACWFTELFPKQVRGAAVGASYNVGRLLSALLPVSIGWAAAYMPLAVVVAGVAAASYGLIVLIIPFLPETRPAFAAAASL
ncbi:MFS transporter [Tardiphaga sp.]|uniref:MFS transporter n=1 Tax=Tardiphaga sp. TaxID=1926292 RepID=UPI00352ADF3A